MKILAAFLAFLSACMDSLFIIKVKILVIQWSYMFP